MARQKLLAKLRFLDVCLVPSKCSLKAGHLGAKLQICVFYLSREKTLIINRQNISDVLSFTNR